MRFSAWLQQQEEIRVVKLPPGAQYQGVALVAGQTNYALELVSGMNTGAEKVEAVIGPLMRPQLERLRDRLVKDFPFPVAGAASAGGIPPVPGGP
jgi:hypothetical protein